MCGYCRGHSRLESDLRAGRLTPLLSVLVATSTRTVPLKMIIVGKCSFKSVPVHGKIGRYLRRFLRFVYPSAIIPLSCVHKQVGMPGIFAYLFIFLG